MIAEHRLAALRRRLVDENVGAFLITSQANMRYVTGFDGVLDTGANAACVVTPEFAWMYTDFRYEELARRAAEGTPWAIHTAAEGLYIDICRRMREEGIDSLALESRVPYGRFKFISEQFVGRVRVVEQWVEELRQIKEAHEIERIEAAAQLVDEAFDHIIHFVKAGRTEKDVALELEMYMRRNGSEGVPFEPIVASGPNSAIPHAHPTDRVISNGDLVKLDMGARVQGYCSDMTRTVVMGQADERQREIHAAVLEAQEAALDAVRPGLAGAGLDKVARDALAVKGLAEHFKHGLGHGVGLEVHEFPRISAQNREPVRTGSVITMEPGVYIPGWGGVRIEDLVVVEESGSRVLTCSPKDLIEL